MMDKIIHTIDATDRTFGRLSSEVAALLRGKNRADYTPHARTDISVVIKNVKGMRFTGNKLSQKKYYRHSGYPGGIHSRTLGQLMEKDPQELVRKAVYKMLPVNRSRDKVIKNLSFE